MKQSKHRKPAPRRPAPHPADPSPAHADYIAASLEAPPSDPLPTEAQLKALVELRKGLSSMDEAPSAAQVKAAAELSQSGLSRALDAQRAAFDPASPESLWTITDPEAMGAALDLERDPRAAVNAAHPAALDSGNASTLAEDVRRAIAAVESPRYGLALLHLAVSEPAVCDAMRACAADALAGRPFELRSVVDALVLALSTGELPVLALEVLERSLSVELSASLGTQARAERCALSIVCSYLAGREVPKGSPSEIYSAFAAQRRALGLRFSANYPPNYTRFLPLVAQAGAIDAERASGGPPDSTATEVAYPPSLSRAPESPTVEAQPEPSSGWVGRAYSDPLEVYSSVAVVGRFELRAVSGDGWVVFFAGLPIAAGAEREPISGDSMVAALDAAITLAQAPEFCAVCSGHREAPLPELDELRRLRVETAEKVARTTYDPVYRARVAQQPRAIRDAAALVLASAGLASGLGLREPGPVSSRSPGLILALESYDLRAGSDAFRKSWASAPTGDFPALVEEWRRFTASFAASYPLGRGTTPGDLLSQAASLTGAALVWMDRLALCEEARKAGASVGELGDEPRVKRKPAKSKKASKRK